MVPVVIKLLHFWHHEKRGQNWAGASPRMGERSNLRSSEKLVRCFSEVLNEGSLRASMAFVCF